MAQTLGIPSAEPAPSAEKLLGVPAPSAGPLDMNAFSAVVKFCLPEQATLQEITDHVSEFDELVNKAWEAGLNSVLPSTYAAMHLYSCLPKEFRALMARYPSDGRYPHALSYRDNYTRLKQEIEEVSEWSEAAAEWGKLNKGCIRYPDVNRRGVVYHFCKKCDAYLNINQFKTNCDHNHYRCLFHMPHHDDGHFRKCGVCKTLSRNDNPCPLKPLHCPMCRVDAYEIDVDAEERRQTEEECEQRRLARRQRKSKNLKRSKEDTNEIRMMINLAYKDAEKFGTKDQSELHFDDVEKAVVDSRHGLRSDITAILPLAGQESSPLSNDNMRVVSRDYRDKFMQKRKEEKKKAERKRKREMQD